MITGIFSSGLGNDPVHFLFGGTGSWGYNGCICFGGVVPVEVDRFGKTVHVYDVGVASFLCD